MSIVQRLFDSPYKFAGVTRTAAVVSFFVACLIFPSAAQSPVATGLDSISAEELRDKVTYISSEKFKGRGNGTPELNMAADYIAAVFEKSGVKPAGDAGRYFQHFDIYSSRLGMKNELRFRGIPNLSADDVKPRTQFLPELWSESGTATGTVQLIEDGNAPLPDLKGKIAVAIEDRIEADDPELSASAIEGRRLQAAGAAALIVVQPGDRNRAQLFSLAEGFRDDLPVRLTPMSTLGIPDYPRIPVVVLSSDIGRQLVAELRKPQAKIEATLTVDVERNIRRTQNVLGVIEGSDPSLKNEVMIVGAHYDHDGEAYGQIWYGADDNGSGTSALLELAEAFGNGSARPARSVLLIAWAGEEKGLLGSRYYVRNPVFPLNRTVAMFQIDMIGRNEDHPANRSQQVPEERAADNANSVNVLGSAFSPDLKTVISRLNSQTSLTVKFRYDFGADDLLRRSDQWSFLQRRIPAVFFFAGLHPDYHTPRDTPEKINYPKLEKVARLVYLSAFEVANQRTPPAYKAATPPQ